MKKLLSLCCAVMLAGVILSGCLAIGPILDALGEKNRASSQGIEESRIESSAAASEEPKREEYSGKYKDLQRVGNDDLGYASIPSNWGTFDDVDVDRALFQFSDPTGKSILTMEMYKKSIMGAEALAKMIATQMETENVKGLTTAKVEIGGYKAYQVYGVYPDATMLVAWYFEAGENVQYIAIESGLADIADLTELIEKTYSLTDKGSGTNTADASGSEKSTQTQRAGNDKMGYVDLPADWKEAKTDASLAEYLQYDNPADNLSVKLTRMNIDNSTLEEASESLYESEKEKDPKGIYGHVEKKIGEYDGFKVSAYLVKKSLQTTYFMLQPNGKETHVIICVGEDIPENDEVVKMIQETYSLKK